MHSSSFFVNSTKGNQFSLAIKLKLSLTFVSITIIQISISTQHVSFLPPSGDKQGVRGRENAHHVDLNRNFPDQFAKTSKNRHQEPETELVMNWIKLYPFVLSANMHGGSMVANYPYDDSDGTLGHSVYSECPDDDVFKELAESYSLVGGIAAWAGTIFL